MRRSAEFAGRRLHVPGFRIARLGPLPEVYPGNLLPPDVLYDVLSITVTQKNTGMSTYTIVLSNNHLSTGADRAAASDTSSSSGGGGGGGTKAAESGFARERLVGSNPAWPRYKYNDFAFFEFGKRLRIDMRYWPQAQDEDEEPNDVAYRDEWTPMIAGPITDIKFDLIAGEDSGMRVTISGHDDLSRLQDFQDFRCDMHRYSEMEAVQHILGELGLSLPRAAPLVEPPPFVDDRAHGIRLSRNANQTSLQFLTELAERLDFEIFVAFNLRLQGHPLEFHFEPYRGRARPDHSHRLLIALERGKTVLKLETKIDVAAQYTEVSVRGRHSETAQAIEARGRTQVRASDLDDELRKVHASDGTITPAPLVRTHYYPGRPNPHDPGPAEGLDPQRAQWRALAILRQKARELCVLTGELLGLPRLRAGNHVVVNGCRPPFDGYYYLTETVHTINADGYRTAFTASRPGMEIPDGSHHFVEASA